MRNHFLIIATFLLTSFSVAAENQCEAPKGAYVNLSVTKVAEVANDLLTASLQVEQDNEDQRALQNSLNEAMAKAITIAKQYKTVATRTDQYYVYQFDKDQGGDDKKKLPPKKMWRGGQTLTLKSTSPDDLLKLTGELQEAGMLVQNLSYSLSGDKKEATRDSLMEEALTALIQKSMRAAKALNKEYDGFTLVSIDPIQQPSPMMPLMGMANPAMEKMAAPVAEPGTSEVSVTVSATAALK